MTKIVSWNVNSVRARLPQVLKWISQANPDILLLQELKCEEATFPREAFEDAGYNIAMAGQKTYNGVAILSKEPLEDVCVGLPGNEEDPQARYIEAVTGKFRVASVYVPNGMEIGCNKYDYKLAFFEHLRLHLKQRLAWNEAFVVGGDYNVAPFEIDGHNPAVFREERILISQQERQALRRILYSGYTDAVRALHPFKTDLFSWWDYRGGAWDANRGYRIDHLLLSPEAVDLLSQAGVDTLPRGEEKASDHAPVWSSFT